MIILLLIELNIQIAGNVILRNKEIHEIIEHKSFIQSHTGYNVYVDEYYTKEFFMVVYTFSERNDKRVTIFDYETNQAKVTWTEVKIETLKTVRK